MSNRLERYQQFPKRLSSARYKTIIFSDEEIFTIEPFMNRQNDHILSPNISSANSNDKLIGRRAHPQSITVWAATAYHGKSSLVFVPQNAKINTETYQILFKIKLLFPGPKSILNPVPPAFSRIRLLPTSQNLLNPSAKFTFQISSPLPNGPPTALI